MGTTGNNQAYPVPPATVTGTKGSPFCGGRRIELSTFSDGGGKGALGPQFSARRSAASSVLVPSTANQRDRVPAPFCCVGKKREREREKEQHSRATGSLCCRHRLPTVSPSPLDNTGAWPIGGRATVPISGSDGLFTHSRLAPDPTNPGRHGLWWTSIAAAQRRWLIRAGRRLCLRGFLDGHRQAVIQNI